MQNKMLGLDFESKYFISETRNYFSRLVNKLFPDVL